jgi:hypothetical protein
MSSGIWRAAGGAALAAVLVAAFSGACAGPRALRRLSRRRTQEQGTCTLPSGKVCAADAYLNAECTR